MAANKVIYNGTTLIDLTGDTVDESSLLEGIIAHGKDGETIVGTCTFDVDDTTATATADEILDEKTAFARGSKLTGTMVNNEGITGVITEKTESYKIPQGYHDGSGSVSIDDTEQEKLIGENIREGITILGVEGTMSGKEEVTTQIKTVIPTAEEQKIVPDEGYNYLSQVTVRAIPYAESDNAAGGITVTIG